MKRVFKSIMIAVFLYTLVTYAQYPSDFTFVKVPNPLSSYNLPYPLIDRGIPNVGESFFDLRFNTYLTRVTETNGIRGRHEYSRHDPFNKDKSMIILDPDVLWNIYSTNSFPYNQSSNLIRTINFEELRWDPVDKNLIWGTEEFKINLINAATGQTTLVKDFSLDPIIGPKINQGNVYRITMMDEGESSSDKRYWAFFLQGNEQVAFNQLYIFTWDKDADTILGLYPIQENERNLDWVGMSPLGNWVLIGGDYDNGGNLTGLTMANKEFTQFHRLDYTTAHADVGLDTDGNEVIIMQNSMTDHIDLIPIDLQTQPILEPGGSYENTNRTPLVRLFYSSGSPHGLQSGVHISCNVPGYCVVSTYIEPGLQEQNWLDRSIIIIRLDRQNPQTYYLAKVYNTTGSYWEETHATITNDGSKIVWASNWGQNVGNEQVFLMQLDMPTNWRDLITSMKINQIKIPDEFELMQNFPNPFNPTARIQYQVSSNSHVSLNVHDVLGNEIATLVNEEKEAGYHSIEFDGSDLPTGVYFYKIQVYPGKGGAGNPESSSGQVFIDTKKMLLLK